MPRIIVGPRFKREFECNLQNLKETVIAAKPEGNQSLVDTIEPTLWDSCEIKVPLHKLMLARAIRKLAGFADGDV